MADRGGWRLGPPTGTEGARPNTAFGRVARVFPSGGYGFIKTRAGAMLYFAATDCEAGTVAPLLVGMRVRFARGVDGLPRATEVAPV